MRNSRFVLLGTLLALAPALATAQDGLVHVNIGGGPTFNLGDLGDHFGTGWGPAIGITIDTPDREMGFQFEYAYRTFGISDSAPSRPLSCRPAFRPTTRHTSWPSTWW